MDKAQTLSFNKIQWSEDAPGIWGRELTVNGARWAIVAYEGGVRREEWCEDGHRGYVVTGNIEYEFDDGREPLQASEGEAFYLPAAHLGEGAHRGRNLSSGSTRLFLIDD